MIERFNFYDVYGYLIPGAVLLIVYMLPVALVGRADLSSWPQLAVGVLVAYILGHFLQAMASTAISSSRGSERVAWRAPSSTMLNPSDKTLTPELKKNIGLAITNWFRLDVQVTKEVDEAIGRVRQDAFFLARRMATESSSYPEQFQGLYTMMRGVTVALWLGSVYTVGWSAALWCTVLSMQIAIEIVGVSLLAALTYSVWQTWEVTSRDRESQNRVSLVLFGVASAACGYILGIGNVFSLSLVLEFAAIAMIYLAASFRFLNAYWFFAREFAKAVWLNFATGPIVRPAEK